MKDIDQLDRFDRKLLAALQEEGRLTNAELADRVGLSSSQCSRRRTDLEKRGVIKGYHAFVHRPSVGFELTSLISISLSHHDENNATLLRDLLCRLPNVLNAYALTGEMDYMVTVVTRDLDELSDIINNTLLPHTAVQNVKTAIALETIKEKHALPLDGS